jgi:hypothetical protein
LKLDEARRGWNEEHETDITRMPMHKGVESRTQLWSSKCAGSAKAGTLSRDVINAPTVISRRIMD